MMNLKKKIRLKLKKIIVNILTEIKKEEKFKAQSNFSNSKGIGVNSKFWGDKIVVTDYTKLEIGENVHIGDNAYFNTNGGLKIGNNTHISRNVTIYTCSHDYESDILPYNSDLILKEVLIGENVWIGMNVSIAPGTIIGEGAIIGIGSVISGYIEPLSIVGSPKCRVLKKRNENHYFSVKGEGRFGKENGELYTKNDKKLIFEIGDVILKKRAKIELVNFKGCKSVKKSFVANDEGIKSFLKEKEMYSLFKNCTWLPKLYEVGDNYLIYEYIDNNCRLDRILDSLDDEKKKTILKEILYVLLEIYSYNIKHRDFHSKNIFYTTDGVKVVDFETAEKDILKKDFFESYDVVMSEEEESPYFTNNMCVMSDSIFSIKNKFDLKSTLELKVIVNQLIKDKLYDFTNSFFTRKDNADKRHKLINAFVYNTFDLKYTKIDDSIGQRRIKKRLDNFYINLNAIQGKTVLDIGSNVGGILLEVHKFNPKKAKGLEYDTDKVNISNIINSLNYSDNNLEFCQMDVESSQFYDEFNEKFEVVFCLAVIEHLKYKEKFISKLSDLCKSVLYFEGNANSNIEFLTNQLIINGFNTVEFIGMSNDEVNINNNNRPLFIAKK